MKMTASHPIPTTPSKSSILPRRLLSLLLLPSLFLTLSQAASPRTTLIDATGTISRSATTPSLSTTTSSSTGIVTIVTSPGTKSAFTTSQLASTSPHQREGVTLNGIDEDSISSSTTMVLTSPGATLTGSSSLARGNGAAAASVVAGSIILNGITESDLEKSAFESTRHGHTLSGIFRARLMVLPQGEEEESGGNMCTLVLVVPTEVEDVDKVIGDVNDIFESAKLGLGLDVTFEDLYDVKIEVVQNDADAVKVMSMASAAATAHTLPPKLSIPSTVIKTYTKMSSTSEPSPSVASAILSCDESMTRNHKTARAKLTAWRSRTQRGLIVDHFGSAALQLRSRAMEQYDRDTILAAGLAGSIAAPYRLETRIRLAGRIEGIVRELFLVQVGLLEDSTLKRFEATLLRKYSGRGPKGGGGIDDATVDTVYDDNAAMVRSAVFAFDTAMDDLVLPSLSLTKAKAVREMTAKLESALAVFPDSAAARLKILREVAKAANKQHAPEVKAAPPSDRSMNVGLDLVAMVRPDGFGSLQGFVGYQLGGNNMIVGIHNDADSPDVIGQFGGTRPPFLRIQPKLKIDVEL